MLAFPIRNILVTLAVTLALAAAGWWGFRNVPVDAIPDLSDNQVVVWADWAGKSAEDVDVQVTSRLTRGLQGLAGVKTVRGLSMYGASYVYVIFDEDRDFYDCRTRVLERLSTLQAQVPSGVVPRLGPDATAMGQIYAFTLQGSTSVEHRRRVLDQTVVPFLQATPGVAEVAPVGGVVREYQIDVDPVQLEEQAITLDALMMAVSRSGRDVGAMSVETSGIETMIRGVGFIRSVEDVERIVVRGDRERGAGLLLKDVARVSIGGAVRQGILADQHGEHAGAIVAMRVGEDPRTVIDGVKRRLMELRPSLTAEGLVAVPFYDRSQLIRETRETLNNTLIEELITTVLVVIAFLLHARASVAIGLTLPLGALTTFLVMHLLGVSANLMSLAGIAIAIGVMVDMGIVMTENIYQHLLALQERLRAQGERMPVSPWDDRIVEAVVAGTREIAPAIVTASLTTIVGFLPIFALDEQAGRLFTPLALTKTLAIAGAALFGLLLVPLLCRLLLPPWKLPAWASLASTGIAAGLAFGWFLGGISLPQDYGRWDVVVPGFVAAPAMSVAFGLLVWRLGAERLTPIEANPVSHAIQRGYRAVLSVFLDHKAAFVAVALAIAAAGWLVGLGYDALAKPVHAASRALGADITRTAPDRALADTFPGIGASFLPPLDEGSLLFMPSILSQGGLGESLRVMSEQNRRIAEVPEVATVMGKMGRAETGLDPAPIGMVETVVVLKPYEEWPVHEMLQPDKTTVRRPRTLAEVRSALASASDIPGVAPSWLQPIETRVVMLSTGIKSLIALQVAGDDPEALERFVESAEKVIQGVPGAGDVTAQREGGKPYAEIRLDHERMARFGIEPEGVMSAIETALGGMPVTVSVEGNQRYSVRIRYARERRDDPDELALTQVPVMSGGHGAIPLASLVAAPVIHDLRFDPSSAGPTALRRSLPLSAARNLTIVDDQRAELVLPAGVAVPPLPAGVSVAASRAHPNALTYTIGPMSIRSENGKRVAYVLLNPAGRAEVEVVQDAERRLRAALDAGELTLPAGATFRWVGRYEQKLHADRILSIVITISMIAMTILIYLGTRRWLTTGIIVGVNSIVGIGGGFLAVWWWGAEMTTAVTVGFIALLGIMFNDGIIMGIYLDEQFKQMPGSVADVRARVLHAGLRRIRPALMTNMTALISLIPILWASGRGAEIMQPMALPVIGGMIADLVSLFSLPVIYSYFQERRVRRAITA